MVKKLNKTQKYNLIKFCLLLIFFLWLKIFLIKLINKLNKKINLNN